MASFKWPDSGSGGGSGVTTIGTLDSAGASGNGAIITGTTLFMQSASGTSPGLVNITAQTLAGTKTFSSPLLISSGTGANPGLAFSAEPNSGLYRPGTGTLAVSILSEDAISVVRDSSGNFSFGFGTAATASTASPLNWSITNAGNANFAYANLSSAATSQTTFYIGNGPGGANPITLENASYTSAGYLSGGGALFASANLTQLNIGSEAVSGYVAFNVGGRTLATERMRLTSTALTINKGANLVLSGATSGALTINAGATGTYAVTMPTAQASGALTNDGSGNLSWAPSQFARVVQSISSPTGAANAANTDYVYLVSGTTTVTLPTAVGNTSLYTIKNVGNATVTISTTSAQTIDGSASASLPVRYTSLGLISDGSNWNVV